MQAFIYRHLTPSQELMVHVAGKHAGPPVELVDDGPVRVPAGGTARVRVKTPRRPTLQNIRLELREPPEGVTVQKVTVLPEGLAIVLKADGDVTRVGFADNLIAEVSAEVIGRKQGGKPPRKRRGLPRRPAGYLI